MEHLTAENLSSWQILASMGGALVLAFLALIPVAIYEGNKMDPDGTIDKPVTD